MKSRIAASRALSDKGWLRAEDGKAAGSTSIQMASACAVLFIVLLRSADSASRRARRSCGASKLSHDDGRGP